MRTQTVDLMTEHLTKAQAATFNRFRERLERRVPGSHITAVEPLKENLIQVWVEIANETYRRGLTACKVAVEVEEETGIYIILT